MARRSKKPPKPSRAKLSAAFSRRSKAAKKGWEARRERERIAALKRQNAAKRAAETRRDRKADARLVKSLGEAKTGTVANSIGGRLRYFLEQDVGAPYGEISGRQFANTLRDLFYQARKEFPDSKVWSGGFRYRLATSDDKEGNPIWETDRRGRYGEQYWQASFRDSFDKARNEAANGAEAKGDGEVHGAVRRHHYRIWIVGLVVYAMTAPNFEPASEGSKANGKTEKKKKSRRGRGIRPGNGKLDKLRRGRTAKKRR
jgi:hypothetical protein